MAGAISYTVAIGSGLTFDDSSTSYRLLPGTGIAERSSRRSLVVAPDVHGAAETSNALDEGLYVLSIRCIGSNWSGCTGLVNTIFSATRVRSYTLTVTVDGLAEAWTARAFTRFSAPLQPELSWSHMREVTVSIPVYPIPS